MKKNKNRDKKQKVAALVDVDHTLLMTDARGNVVNEKLIKSLKQQGIHDIYLFTDMTFNASGLEDRKELVQLLEKKYGMNVRGVITSPDYAWHLGENVNGLMDQFVEQDINLKTGKNKDKLDTVLQTIDGADALLSGDIERQNESGAAFAEVSSQDFDRSLKDRSLNCKLLFDLAADREGIKDGKGLLFRQFVTHRPRDIAAVVVVDDKETCLSSVKAISERDGHPIPVCTIQVTSFDQDNYNQVIGQFYRDNGISVSKTKLGLGKKKAHVGILMPTTQPAAPSSSATDDVLNSLTGRNATPPPPKASTSITSGQSSQRIQRKKNETNLLQGVNTEPTEGRNKNSPKLQRKGNETNLLNAVKGQASTSDIDDESVEEDEQLQRNRNPGGNINLG